MCLHSVYISRARVEGIRLALEAPEKIQFISQQFAIFHDDQRGRVYKLVEINGQWQCNCDKSQTLQKNHFEPICMHTVAVGRIIRESNFDKIAWLFTRQHKATVSESALV